MKRGELYRVCHPQGDTKKSRVFAVVSRQELLDSRFSTAICAPVYSRRDGLETQVDIGVDDGLKHESSIHCDDLKSILKSKLTDYVGRLPNEKISALNHALRVALAVE